MTPFGPQRAPLLKVDDAPEDARGVDARDLQRLRTRMNDLADAQAADAKTVLAERDARAESDAKHAALTASIEEEARWVERDNQRRLMETAVFDLAVALATYVVARLFFRFNSAAPGGKAP